MGREHRIYCKSPSRGNRSDRQATGGGDATSEDDLFVHPVIDKQPGSSFSIIMAVDRIASLPVYPSVQTRKSLSPSQLASLTQNIAASLHAALNQKDTPAARNYLTSYLKDTAFQSLQGLIWGELAPLSRDEKLIKRYTLLLAEKLATSPPGLDVQTLLDLSIVYARTNTSKTKTILTKSAESGPINVVITNDLVPAFTLLLAQSQTSAGLYGLHKSAHLVSSLLHAAPSALIRPFAHSKEFLLALAKTYDSGLTSIAHSYGGFPLDTATSRETDEWERIWLETKVSLIDTFHIILTTLLNDLSSTPPRALAAESERTFSLIFSLLELTISDTNANVTTTPFLDRSLLADYQHSYDLSRTLASALRHATETDARLDLLESSLRHLDNSPPPPTSATPGTTNRKNPGALKFLLRSSGVQSGIDNLGKRSTSAGINFLPPSANKGKGRATHRDPADPDTDIKVTQVLDILPDFSPSYIRALLEHTGYGWRGSVEGVVEALLEGRAPLEKELVAEGEGDGDFPSENSGAAEERDEGWYVREGRKNVFDGIEMDLHRVTMGKKRWISAPIVFTNLFRVVLIPLSVVLSREDENTILRDRTFIEQMKADILRRAEAISDDEDEEEEGNDDTDAPRQASRSKGKYKVPSDREGDDSDVDLDGVSRLKIGGDGEESSNDPSGSDDDDNEGGGGAAVAITPESILELAYMSDPAVFARDAVTRRGKVRVDLRARTGWGDEQIEGWKIMLERDVSATFRIADD